MGSALEIGIQMRKLLTISIRTCYKFVCDHPFLLGFLGFLMFLYRSFPFAFSILVSASPVLVCTAILLGTLLTFGQTNIPEVEEEEKVTHGISSFQTGFSEGATCIAERDENFVVKRYTENTSATGERSIKEASLAGDKANKVEEYDGLMSSVPLIDENSRNIQHEKQVIEKKERDDHEEKLKAQGVSSVVEAVEKQYVMIQKVNDILDNDIGNEETPMEPFDIVKGDHLNFSPSSSWKQAEKNEEEESLESWSDAAESSSPDASMADIIPMLDELHPLLDLETPQHVHLSHDGSDVAREKSLKSHYDNGESDEDTENLGEVEEDDDEEEGMESGKEDDSKSAIKWTEDDQKNLMDLGTLELERNQRLENLIARRKAWRQMNEKNLIDLESADVPSNVAPIVTTRRNPFDIPDDSYVAMGFPPIPGSAPSILQPRRNPFDIPYDSNEEKPDPKGDSLQQDLMMSNQNDTFFCRHESFSLGPSVLGITKHERQDIYWKSIFVSEQMASEGTSYSSFQRQSSEVSDSKLSSVPDTESVSSIDRDERKFNEQDLPQEIELISTIDQVERGSQVDSVEIIQSEESHPYHGEVELVLGGVENPSEESSCKSSRSSLSEVIDSIPDEKQEKSASLQQGDNHLQESRISTQASVEESDSEFVSSEVEENQHREPVYDSSPPTAGKLLSFFSVSSDSATEFSERNLGTLNSQHLISSDSSISAPQDLQPSPLAGQAPSVHPNLSSEGTEHVEKILLVEQEKVFSSSSIEQGNTDLHQDLDKNAVSSSSNCQNAQFEVKPRSDLENNLSRSDKSVATPSFSDRDEIQVESMQGVRTSNNEVVEFYDAVDKFVRTVSFITFDSSETPEFKSFTDKEDLAVDGLGGDPKEVLEHLNPSVEGYNSQVTGESVKNFDEGILSELDTVGSSPKDIKIAEGEQDIPVLEARSIEDVDRAFKQLQEGVDVKEVILPSMIKDQPVSEESKGNLKANSDLQVDEARSLDDINIALELILEGNQGKSPKTLDLKDESVEVEANEVGSAKVVEFFDALSSSEEISRIPVGKLKNFPNEQLHSLG